MNYFFLFIGLLLYGLFGSPTPDTPGLIELVIFVCLLAGLWPYLLNLFATLHTQPPAFYFFFFYMLAVPLMTGTLAGHGFSDILRDYIALSFLLLPLLANPPDTKLHKTILIGILIIACAFSVRSIVPSLNIFQSPFERLYLANSPLLLFLALYAVGKAFYAPRVPIILLAIFMTTLVLFVSIQNEQRATIALLGCGGLLCALANLHKKPFIVLMFGASALLCALLLTHQLQDIFDILHKKHMFVGSNNRDMEWQAIATTWAEKPLSFITGNGWGARLLSSAAGPTGVNYVHGLLPNIVFKTGLIGLCLTIWYSAHIFIRLARSRTDISNIIAIALPLLLMMTLYGSYKSLDFGLLLLFAATYKLREGIQSYSNMAGQKQIPAV
ncbi:MAG: hypothetical protein GC136_02285 [Alphaproteobacteria bacterium]|nr:hypothetical protein [Alphaproteobacteria bacterium]